MKKFRILSLLTAFAFIGMLIFTGCGKDDNVDPIGPTLFLTAAQGYVTSTATVNPGDTFKVRWEAKKGDGDLASFTIKLKDQNTTVPGFPKILKGDDQNTYIAESEIKAPSVSGTYVYTLEVIDENALTANQEITITVATSIHEYTAVLLAAPLGNEDSKSFYSSDNNMTYSKNEGDNDQSIQAKIDMGYYYGQTNKASLSNINTFPTLIYDIQWTTENATMFKMTSMTKAEFQSADKAAIVAAATGADKTGANNLAVDQVVGFVTHDGKHGLILVTELKAGISSADYIKIQVRREK